MSGDDTRERILEAAAPLFAAEGFAGASTRAIALAAGVNIATIAYHFGDKQGLYEALVDRTYGRLLAFRPDDVDLPAPADRLRALVRALYAFARAHHVEVRVLLRHVLEHRRLPSTVSEKWIGPLLGRVTEALAPVGVTLTPERLLGLLSLNHLIVRYALSEPEDLAVFAAGSDPHAAVAAHLGDVAVRLLLDG